MCLPCARLRIRCAAAMLCLGSGIPCGSPSRSHGSDTRQADAPPPKHTHAHKPFVSGHARIAAKCHEFIVFVSSAMESHTCVCSLRLRLAVAHSRLKMVKVADPSLRLPHIGQQPQCEHLLPLPALLSGRVVALSSRCPLALPCIVCSAIRGPRSGCLSRGHSGTSRRAR